ncbi:MAG: uracil-DNA glycosylase [Halocynthiibacter sp.]
MDSAQHAYDDFVALDWQVDLGADEAIQDSPVNRYALEDRPQKIAKSAPAAAPKIEEVETPKIDVIAEAKAQSGGAATLEALKTALLAFPHCDLKRGARNMIFAEGTPEARVMVIHDFPTRDEDRAGVMCGGRDGPLFDRMFAAIGLSRTTPEASHALYLVNAVPWHVPRNRKLTKDEMGILSAFLARHIEIADPDVIVVAGNIACEMVLQKSGVSRLRGTWDEALTRPVLPFLPAARVLQNPSLKREAWADLLALKSKLGIS